MDVEHSVPIRIEDCAPIRIDGCVPINVDKGSASAYVRFDRKAEASAVRAALCQHMLEVPTSQDLGQAASGDHAQQKAAAVARKSSLSSGHKRARTS